MSSLHMLGIAANHIEGEIPSEIGNLLIGETYGSELGFLSTLSNCPSRQVLSLGGNPLRGSMPESIKNFSISLQILIAPNCQIRGRVPEEMGFLKRLTLLDLGNALDSNIPSSIGRLERLQRLYLDNNHLEGPIPDEISNLTSLGELELVSRIHATINWHLKGLEFLDLSYIELSNTMLESLEGLAYLQILNLSFNKLSGEIPNCGPFGNFPALSFNGNEALYGNAIFQVPRCKENGMKSSRDKRLHILYIVVPILLAILLVLVIYLLRKSGSTSKASVSMENLPRIGHPMISYWELCLATNNFGKSNLLKAGSFSSVYEGTLANGIDIAVKVLNLHIEGALKGFDPSNILLNEGLVAQVCDFGIAKILAESKLETQTQTLDTIVYIALEYGSEGKVSYKGNLYDFSILLLEVITRKKPTGEMFNADLSLRQWVDAAIPKRVLDIMDSKILCTKYEDPTLLKFNSIVFLILELRLECSKDLLEEIMDMKIVVIKLSKIELSLP
ncbi:hypothetical protein EUGRSUZ_C03758 [Eucalyptus grandis]|uniref:Uncharacterized protein n=2 Tax=Eucalyptus grandis TaxID=71139 RepID=A0A059CWN4_EUCGR|nr:hypothetical protein EUGRSUZ_C03758 [Eucalyptus grandis]